MTIQLKIDERPVHAEPGDTLLDSAEDAGLRIPTSCNKNGKCGECLVEVIEGGDRLSPRTNAEEHLTGPFRLACQARLNGDGGRVHCHSIRRGAMVIASGGESLVEVLVDVPLDPAVARDGKWILIDGQPIAESAGPLLGLAIDLGTTTVVVRLVDLESGRALESQAFENPQRFGGSDVMARIAYDAQHLQRHLQRSILSYLARAIHAFDCRGDQIYEVVLAGNTTMRDLFFGLDVQSIGQRPYQSLTEQQWQAGQRESTVLTATGCQLQLPVHPEARVYGMPLVSSHVGADAAACMLAIDLDHEDRLVALMDIGTNTELIVGNRHKLLVASCPAGPAFEGGLISCGMPGLEGAIEGITLKEDGTLDLRVIGGGPAQGVCGSGLVDLSSELLRTGKMDHFGRLTSGEDRFPIDSEGFLFLSEQDLSHLAQAKGANVAGLRIVLGKLGAHFEQIDRFYLAGGFAKHLRVDAAKRIGLIPDIAEERMVQVGNAAIEGATIALCSTNRRSALERLVGQVTHVELETDEQFFNHFVEGCLYRRVQSPE